MSTSRVRIDAPPEAVYETLLDAWSYELWVRGTKRIRDVDDDWPAPGSRFHHSIGIGPLATRDESRLVAAEPSRFLELDVHLWPLGRARVRIDLKEEHQSTLVTISEEFVVGPGLWMNNRLQERALQLRNHSGLDQLKRLVEQRHRMRG